VVTQDWRTGRDRLLSLGVAPSTRTRYDSSYLRYRNLCTRSGISPWPITQSKIQRFIVARAGSVSASSIRHDLSALNSMRVDTLHEPLRWSAATTRMLRGAAALDPPHQPRQDAMTPALLTELLQQCEADTLTGAVLACAYTFAFVGLFRPGELTSRTPASPALSTLRLSDVVLLPQGLTVRLRTSKTSQHRPILVPVGASGGVSCPLAAFTRMLKLRRREGLDCHPDSYLFLLPSGRPLSRARFGRDLTELGRAQSPPLYLTPRSFRIGGATTLHLAQLPDHIIRAAGRWKSDTFMRYCRAPPSTLLALARSMLSGGLGGLGGPPSRL